MKRRVVSERTGRGYSEIKIIIYNLKFGAAGATGGEVNSQISHCTNVTPSRDPKFFSATWRILSTTNPVFVGGVTNLDILLSDSLFSLQAIQDPHSPNLIVQRILILLHSLSSFSYSCAFLSNPGHINLPDHDALDFAAK